MLGVVDKSVWQAESGGLRNANNVHNQHCGGGTRGGAAMGDGIGDWLWR
jgi:hypothetical protein